MRSLLFFAAGKQGGLPLQRVKSAQRILCAFGKNVQVFSCGEQTKLL